MNLCNLRTATSAVIARVIRSAVIARVSRYSYVVVTPNPISRHPRQMHGERPICTLPSVRSTSTLPQPNFKPIYKFPYIVHATVVCRLKLYQTIITIMMVPATAVGYMTGLTSALQCQLAVFLSCFACAVLYVMGTFFSRLIGIMYMNEERNEVRISHLTFMGKRRDDVVPVQDVVPFSDTGETLNAKKVYYALKRYSTQETLYLIVRYGGILQPQLFQEVFGEEILKLCPSATRDKKTDLRKV